MAHAEKETKREPIIINADDLDRVVFGDESTVSVEMSTRILGDDENAESVEQTLKLDLSGETLGRVLMWAAKDRRIAFQTVLRSPSNGYTVDWQRENPTVTVRTVDQWTERVSKKRKPVTLADVKKAVKNGDISAEEAKQMAEEILASFDD